MELRPGTDFLRDLGLSRDTLDHKRRLSGSRSDPLRRRLEPVASARVCRYAGEGSGQHTYPLLFYLWVPGSPAATLQCLDCAVAGED